MSSLLELSNSTVGGIKEVTIGINEINRAMTDLKEITLESKASTENVQEEIKHFKI